MGLGIIHENVSFTHPWRIVAKDGFSINEGCSFVPGGIISIGKNVRIASKCCFVASDHVYSRTDIPIKNQGYNNEDIIIHDDVWIGVNTTILKGVTINEGAIVAAGSLVTKNVPKFSIVAGVPSKIISKRTSHLK